MDVVVAPDVFSVLVVVSDRTPPEHDGGQLAGVSRDQELLLPLLPPLPLLPLLLLLPHLPGVPDNSIKTYNKLPNKALIQTLRTKLSSLLTKDITY